jgi:SAM-dependent methyltransferase
VGPGDEARDAGSAAALREFRRRDDERRAAAYGDFFAPVTAELAARGVELLGPAAGTVLDVGGGDGRLAPVLVRAGWRVVAADLSRAMSGRARSAGVPAVVADAGRLPVRTGSVPAVLAAFLLPHMSELAPVLAELRRVLAPGGRAVLVTWAEPGLSPFTGVATAVLADRLPPQRAPLLRELHRRTDTDHLEAELRAAGFTGTGSALETVMAELPSVEAWWTGLLASSCGLGGLLRTGTPAARQELRAAFDAAALTYRQSDGSVLVPASAVIVAGRAGSP